LILAQKYEMRRELQSYENGFRKGKKNPDFLDPDFLTNNLGEN